MTLRLQKLREQRDLIHKHLEWIDTEIASEEPASIEKKATPTRPPPSPISDPTLVPEPVGEPTGETSIAPDPLEDRNVGRLQSQVRRGCLLYFGLAWLVLAAVTGFVYLTYS
jgi:hypothetical protein